MTVPLRKPNRREDRLHKAQAEECLWFSWFIYCFIVLLCVCFTFRAYVIYPTTMARYSLFVLKVPLNTKQTNKLMHKVIELRMRLTRILQCLMNVWWTYRAREMEADRNKPAEQWYCCWDPQRWRSSERTVWHHPGRQPSNCMGGDADLRTAASRSVLPPPRRRRRCRRRGLKKFWVANLTPE